ncbi:MAG: hypothetical protein M1830_001527 [Pleopsidium flavum]|nr:MAG: hypothetical protein M1830_001527 [Pleopsidium flavum]
MSASGVFQEVTVMLKATAISRLWRVSTGLALSYSDVDDNFYHRPDVCHTLVKTNGLGKVTTGDLDVADGEGVSAAVMSDTVSHDLTPKSAKRPFDEAFASDCLSLSSLSDLDFSDVDSVGSVTSSDSSEDDIDLNVSRFENRLFRIMRCISKLAINNNGVIGPRFRDLLNTTAIEEVFQTILKATVFEVQQLLGRSTDDMWTVSDLKYAEKTWHTSDHGCYLCIAEDPAGANLPALYVGAAYGLTSSLYVRISQHLNERYRARSPSNILYSYIDGSIDVERDPSFVVLARYPRDRFENAVTRQTYIELTETVFMALFGTIVLKGGQSKYEISAWRDMYPVFSPQPCFPGCNQKSSVETYRGAKGGVVNEVAMYNNDPAARRSITKDRKISLRPGTERRYYINIGVLQIAFDCGLIQAYGFDKGDKMTTLLEITPDFTAHPNSWANTDGLPADARERANCLGICLSGKAKKQNDAIGVGQDFSIWLRYDIPYFEPPMKVYGFNRVNIAMTIIEWMLHELIVPIPPNRVSLTRAPKLLEYSRKKKTDMTGWTVEERKQHQKAYSTENYRKQKKKKADIKRKVAEGLDDRTDKQTLEDVGKWEHRKAAANALGAQYRKNNKEQSKIYSFAYRVVNTDRISAQGKEYYKENKEKIKARLEGNKEKISARQKKRYEENKEKLKAQSKAWYEKNKEKIKARDEGNKEKKRAQSKKNYEENKEKRLAQSRVYDEKNKEKKKANRKKKRAEAKEHSHNNREKVLAR